MKINIIGIICNGCVSSISNVLTNIPGVSREEVSLEHNCVTVSYNPTLCSPAQFKVAIEDVGFTVLG